MPTCTSIGQFTRFGSVGLSCVAALSLVGCISRGSDFVDQAPPGVVAEAPAPESSDGSLFAADRAIMSNEEVAAVFAQKVGPFKDARVAVVRHGPVDRWQWYSEEFAQLDDANHETLAHTLGESKAIDHVLVLPGLLAPNRMTVGHLRQAAARMQADLIFVYRTSTRTFTKRTAFAPDEVKAYSMVESVLIDTRTGLVVSSATASETYTAKRTQNELEFRETIAKAERLAIGRALVRTAKEILNHLD